MIQLTDATVIVNNEAIAILPNTLTFDEGEGEQIVRAASIGGGKAETIYSQDIESKVGMVKFELPTTPENIELARSWKKNQNRNVVTIAGSTPEGDVTRTFTQSAVTNNYEVNVGSETSIEIVLHGNSPI